MRVKLSEVAAAADVSMAAASLALRGEPGVSPATVAKVRAVAARLGYTPDAAARALARGDLRGRGEFYGSLALLLHPEAMRQIAARPFPRPKSYFDELQDTAEALGYTLEMHAMPQTRAAAATLARLLRARGIRGVVTDAGNLPVPEVGFPWENFATVMLSAPPGEVRFHRISAHSLTDTLGAVETCHARGYRRPGLLVDEGQFSDWHGGFDAATAHLGLHFPGNVLHLTKWDPTVFHAWVKRARVDVVIGNHQAKPLDELRASGRSVPDDIGYFCLDVDPPDARLSGYEQSRAVRNRLAIETLHGALRRGEFGLPETSLLIGVTPRWIEGGTLRPKGCAAPETEAAPKPSGLRAKRKP
jgi:DNA-binding LacI/PurR family transcriptional regulator